MTWSQATEISISEIRKKSVSIIIFCKRIISLWILQSQNCVKCQGLVRLWILKRTWIIAWSDVPIRDPDDIKVILASRKKDFKEAVHFSRIIDCMYQTKKDETIEIKAIKIVRNSAQRSVYIVLQMRHLENHDSCFGWIQVKCTHWQAKSPKVSGIFRFTFNDQNFRYISEYLKIDLTCEHHWSHRLFWGTVQSVRWPSKPSSSTNSSSVYSYGQLSCNRFPSVMQFFEVSRDKISRNNERCCTRQRFF